MKGLTQPCKKFQKSCCIIAPIFVVLTCFVVVWKNMVIIMPALIKITIKNLFQLLKFPLTFAKCQQRHGIRIGWLYVFIIRFIAKKVRIGVHQPSKMKPVKVDWIINFISLMILSNLHQNVTKNVEIIRLMERRSPKQRHQHWHNEASNGHHD